MHTHIRIAVSPTAIKVSAAKSAASRASADLGIPVEIIESKHKFPSRIPEQPGDLVEGGIGALNRAQPLLDAPDAAEATHVMSAENTATYLGNGKWSDPAVIRLLGRDGSETAVSSLGFPMPNKALGGAIADGHAHTAGSEIGPELGCDPGNWSGAMSGGLLPRDKILADAMYAAIVFAFYQAQKKS